MPSKSDYLSLLRRFQPRPIHSKEALSRAYKWIDQLMSKPKLSRDEADMLEMLSMLVERYESIEHPTPDVSPAEMLAHLMEERGLSNAELARQTNIPRSTVTEILKGERSISKTNVSRLADAFGVLPGVFLGNSGRDSK